MSNNTTHNAVRALVEGAVMVALAEILGFLKIWHMPEGGSVSLMMLPIIVYALRWGLGQGLLAGVALGVLDFILNPEGFGIGWQSILGDYMVALTALGLAGVGHKKGLPGVIVGSIVGCLGRFISIWITGATVWGENMYDIYGLPMNNEFVYSFLYNLPVLVSGVITVIICVIIYNIKPMQKYLLGNDIA